MWTGRVRISTLPLSSRKPDDWALGFGGTMCGWEPSFFPSLKCLLILSFVSRKKIKLPRSQTASPGQESVNFLVDKTWVDKVKGCQVRSWILLTSAGSFSLPGCPNFRCSQKRGRCLTWVMTMVTKTTNPPPKQIDYCENMFHFIGFQTLTLEMLLTCASWGFCSSKRAQLIITGVENGNNHCCLDLSHGAWSCADNTEHTIQGWELDTCAGRYWPCMLIHAQVPFWWPWPDPSLLWHMEGFNPSVRVSSSASLSPVPKCPQWLNPLWSMLGVPKLGPSQEISPAGQLHSAA